MTILGSVRSPWRAALVAMLTVATLLGLPATRAEAAATTFTIGTHNTLHGQASFPGFADIIGYQELDTAESQQRMKNAMSGYGTWIPDGPAGEDSIAWRSSLFSFVRAEKILTHVGEAGVTPNRYVVYVILDVRATGKRFAFVDTHFISGAFSGNPERQDRWYHHEQVLKDTVANLSASMPVFVVGDFNHQPSTAMPGLTRYGISSGDNTPIDQMYATDSNVAGQADRLANYGSDHPAYRGPAKLGAGS